MKYPGLLFVSGIVAFIVWTWVSGASSPFMRCKNISEYREGYLITENISIVRPRNNRNISVSQNIQLAGAIDYNSLSSVDRQMNSMPFFKCSLNLDSVFLTTDASEVLKKYQTQYPRGSKVKIVYHVLRDPKQNPYIDDAFFYTPSWKEDLKKFSDWEPNDVTGMVFVGVFGLLWLLSLIPVKDES